MAIDLGNEKMEVEAALRCAIVQAISSPAGLSVAFAELMVYRMEDGRYAVECDEWQHLWTDANNAAIEFMAVRKTMKLGFDFETPRRDEEAQRHLDGSRVGHVGR